MESAKTVKESMGGVRRSSNLELYRIICILMIVAHHCVVNSGLIASDPITHNPSGPLGDNPTDINTLLLWAFGMWGKTGINCFLMITGYFMCKSAITLRKFVKLLVWIYTYRTVIYIIFLITGYETFSVVRMVKLLMPVWGFNANFTSCFIGFWLTIPFWNILIRNMDKRQYRMLLLLLLGMYTVLGSVPNFNITFNYVTWFGVIYLVAAYIRMYPHPLFNNRKFWMCMTCLTVFMAICSMSLMLHLFGVGAVFFVSDSNKILAVAVAVSSFLWFKNIDLRYSRFINMAGASTFGVLLIHANSDAMRQWLWKDVIDCVGHYSLPPFQLICYFTLCVIMIFAVCTAIDIVRIKLIEEPFFKWFDKKDS